MLVTRIITGAVFGIALTATMLWAPTPVTISVLGLLWLIGAWEWAGFARLSGLEQSAYVLAFAAAMAAAWLWLAPTWTTAILVVAVIWWLVALWGVLTFPRPVGLRFAAAAGFFVLLPAWWLLGQLHGREPVGRELALTILVVVWAADVGAYFCGRRFGRHKLAPAVSPGKTWEGVAGGLSAAAVVAALAGVWLGVPSLGLALVGAATAAVSVLGDLTQSMFKRNVGLKDSGKLLPGHGGVLDRIDSLTAAVPIFVLGLKLLEPSV